MMNIIWLEETDSTNNYLSALAKEKELPDFQIVCTRFQTSGKGLGKNSWESEFNKNLLCSILLRPKGLKAEQQFYLSKIISIAVKETIDLYINPQKASIKWPNDIYIERKKVCGILIENSYLGNQAEHSIIGIGLNVNQETFSSELPNPISLITINKLPHSVEEILNTMLEKIKLQIDILNKQDFEQIDQNYHQNMLQYNKKTRFIFKNITFEATIEGTNQYGLLQLRHDDKSIKHYDLKELKWIL